jgi:hypothetical protein
MSDSLATALPPDAQRTRAAYRVFKEFDRDRIADAEVID